MLLEPLSSTAYAGSAGNVTRALTAIGLPWAAHVLGDPPRWMVLSSLESFAGTD